MVRDTPSPNVAHRSAIETLRVALEEEAKLAPALLEKQQNAMKEAVDALTEASSDVKGGGRIVDFGNHTYYMYVRWSYR